MANNGLKSYTKQLSGSISILDYYINLYNADKNLIFNINLLSYGIVNPIGLNLLFNLQNKNVSSKFGNGIRSNYDYEILDSTNNIIVKNPDGSLDVYSLLGNLNDDENKRLIYTSLTTDNTLEVYSDETTIKAKLIDKYGNYIAFKKNDNNDIIVDHVVFKNGFIINVNPSNNTLLNNGKGIVVSYTLENDKISEIVLKENNVTKQSVEFTYVNNLLTDIVIKQNNIKQNDDEQTNNEQEILFIEYSDNKIEIRDYRRNMGVLFNLSNDIITSIVEKYYTNNDIVSSNIIYQLNYQETKTVVTNKFNKTNELYFIDGLCIYEKDSYNNYKDYRYNDYKKIVYKGNTVNLEKAIDNKITLTPLTSYTEVEDEFINGLNMKCYNVTSNDLITFNTLVNGTTYESYTALILWKKQNINDYSSEVLFKLRAYKDNVVIKEESTKLINSTTNYEYKSIGITLDSPCDKLEIIVVSTNIIGMVFSEPILIKAISGVSYEYNELNNIDKAIYGTKYKEYYYESNMIKDQVSSRKDEYINDYDTYGNPIRTVDSYGVNNNLKYNDNHQLTSERKNIKDYEIETTYAYTDSNLVEVTDSEGNKTIYEYDDFHRILNTSYLGLTEVLDYDNYGNVENVEVSNADESFLVNIDYTYEYDNIKTISSPSGSIYRFVYTTKQQISNIYVDEQLIISYTYNNLDLITTKSYGTDNYYTFNYNDNQLITSISFVTSTRYELEYDSYNRLIKEVNVIDETRNKTYEYNYNNQITKETDDGHVIHKNYDVSGKLIKEKKVYDGYTLHEEHMKNVGFPRPYISRLEGLYNNTGYVGSLYYSDTNLKGVINNETVRIFGVYESAYEEEQCVKYEDGINLIKPTWGLTYDITNSEKKCIGSIGMWVKVNDVSVTNPLIWLKNKDENNENIGLYVNNEELFMIINNSLFTPSYILDCDKENVSEQPKIISNTWHFISFSWNIEEIVDSDENNTISLTSILYVDGVRYKLSIISPSNPNPKEYECILGYYSNGNYGLCLDGAITAITVNTNQMMDEEYLNKYYEYTKEYIISRGTENISDVLDYNSKTYIEGVTGYEIYPLHNSLNSLNGTKPKSNKMNGELSFDIDNYFCYNHKNKRYCYLCYGNEVDFNTNSYRSGSFSLNVYIEETKTKQYIIELYDSSNNKLSLWLDKDNYINITTIDTSFKTTLHVLNKQWNKITLGYGLTSSRRYNINVKLNALYQTYTKDLSTEFGVFSARLGYSKEGNYPLHGQIEMFSITSSQNVSNTHEFNLTTKSNEYDEFRRLRKSFVLNGNTEVLSNVLNYKEITKVKDSGTYITPTFEIQSEEIKYGNTTNTRSYTYDDKYRITGIIDSLFGNKTYGYNDRGYLVNDNGQSISYDSNGNIESYGNNHFEYNSNIKDRLDKYNDKEITYSSINPLYISAYDGKEFSYEGNRLVKVKNVSSSTEYFYKYDINGLRISKTNTFDSVGNKYYYQNGVLVTDISSERRLDFLYDENQILYGFILNKTTKYFYVRDILQNILGIINESGSLVCRYSYTAFGIPTIEMEVGGIGTLNPIRYKGYYYDNEIGMYYCNSRYYSPEFCRFISPDNVEYLEPQNINGLNLYCYCGNNPNIIFLFVCASGNISSNFNINLNELSNSCLFDEELPDMPEWAKWVVGGLAITGLAVASILTFGTSNIGVATVGAAMLTGGVVTGGINIIDQLHDNGSIDWTEAAIHTMSGTAFGLVIGLTGGTGGWAITGKFIVATGTSLLNSWNDKATYGETIASLAKSLIITGAFHYAGTRIGNFRIGSTTKFINEKQVLLSKIGNVLSFLWSIPAFKVGIIRSTSGVFSSILNDF